MIPILVAALLAGAFVPLMAAEADAVTVQLSVNAGTSALPAWRACDVVVPARADAGDVLDQAVLDGCILEWTSAEFPQFGRYVVSIDHVTEAVATFWAFSVNGAMTDYGIDSYVAAEGDSVAFTYTEWVVPL